MYTLWRYRISKKAYRDLEVRFWYFISIYNIIIKGENNQIHFGRHIGHHLGYGNFVVVTYSVSRLQKHRVWNLIFNDNIIITEDINEIHFGCHIGRHLENGNFVFVRFSPYKYF